MVEVICDKVIENNCEDIYCSCSVPHDKTLWCKCKCWRTGEYIECKPVKRVIK